MQFSVEHIGLAARDPIALKDWYVRVLSAEVIFQVDQPSPAFFIKLAGGYCFEIYGADRTVDDTSVNRVAGWRHLALRVPSIEASRDLLTLRGVDFVEPVRAAGGAGRVLFFKDLENNLLHLVERPDSFLSGKL